MALAQLCKTEGAISYYQNALQINSNYADAHNNLGVTLGRRRQKVLVTKHFREAISFSPAYAEANNLKILLLKQGNSRQLHFILKNIG